MGVLTFDVVHMIYFLKLRKMGIKGKAKISKLQGSILSPIVFLCFINDLYRLTNCLTLMFADDTFCLKSYVDPKTLIYIMSTVNREINLMAVWFCANKLAVNNLKTKYIIFTMRGS
jgi:hypothetical protein